MRSEVLTFLGPVCNGKEPGHPLPSSKLSLASLVEAERGSYAHRTQLSTASEGRAFACTQNTGWWFSGEQGTDVLSLFCERRFLLAMAAAAVDGLPRVGRIWSTACPRCFAVLSWKPVETGRLLHCFPRRVLEGLTQSQRISLPTTFSRAKTLSPVLQTAKLQLKVKGPLSPFPGALVPDRSICCRDPGLPAPRGPLSRAPSSCVNYPTAS